MFLIYVFLISFSIFGKFYVDPVNINEKKVYALVCLAFVVWDMLAL